MKDMQYNKLIKAVKETIRITLLLSICVQSGHVANVGATGQFDGEDSSARTDHARELIGASHRLSAFQKSVSTRQLKTFIYDEVQRSLPKRWKNQSDRISRAIIEESRIRGWDPLFLMALIKTESAFNPDARGTVGEIGLMQVRPSTARWISENLGVPARIARNIKDPVFNIKTGAAYITYLRDHFARKKHFQSKFYLAAYNMGIQNLNRAIRRKVNTFSYSKRVIGHYENLYHYLSKSLSIANVVAANQ